MEWVETTGRTVEDAKEAALDQLGIDGTEAEFEVLEEAKTGLFGRVRADARVRGRVAPRAPRPKQERRPRKQRGAQSEKAKKDTSGSSEQSDDSGASSGGDGRKRSGAKPQNAKKTSDGSSADAKKGNSMTDDVVGVDQQADIIGEFLEGLVGAFSAEGELVRNKVDDDTVELGVQGDDLGLLIGPKGQTLTAVHELSRTVLQRRATGRHDGRVRIDIGGYRQRRQEALARFVQAQASEVASEGVQRAMEAMNAADRKVVHDTINEIDGVSTLSEGADPHRRVILIPEGVGADE